MANTIQLRRSATASAVPTTAQLALGEIAINTYDGKLYLKKSVSGTESIVDISSGTGINLQAYTETKVTNATTTGTVTLDLSTSNVFHNTLTGNTTFAFSNPPANTKVFSFSIITIQDATGGRTITWPASKKFAGGVTPPPTTAANAVDVWSVMTYDGGTSYIVSLSVKDAK